MTDTRLSFEKETIFKNQPDVTLIMNKIFLIRFLLCLFLLLDVW